MLTGGGEVDNTNYSFGLKITVPPATPSGAGAEAFYRLIATVVWDGSKITSITPLFKKIELHGPTHGFGGADAITRLGLADGSPAAPAVTFASDSDSGMYRAAAGQLGWALDGVERMRLAPGGQLRLPTAGAGAGILLGGDAGLYRPTVGGGLKTDGALAVGGTLSVGGVATGITPAADSNNTQLATTQYVLGQASAINPLIAGIAAPGVSSRFARQDHRHPIDTSRAPISNPVFQGNVYVGATDAYIWRGSVGASTALQTSVPVLAPSLYSLGWMQASRAASSQTTIGEVVGWAATGSGVTFGLAGDTLLYRSAAAQLRTDGSLIVGQALTAVQGAYGPTVASGDNSTALATTAWVRQQGYATGTTTAGLAPLNSPNFTGLPTAPLPPLSNSGSQIATTQWVMLQGFASTGAGQSVAYTNIAQSFTAIQSFQRGEGQTALAIVNTNPGSPTSPYMSFTDGAGAQILMRKSGAELQISDTTNILAKFSQLGVLDMKTGYTTNSVSIHSNATPIASGGAAMAGVSLGLARADHVHPSDPTKVSAVNPSFTGTSSFGGAPIVLWNSGAITTPYSIGIGTPYQAANGRISLAGSVSELSLTDRNVGIWYENPTAGQRWSNYALGGNINWWSGSDRMSLTSGGQLRLPAGGSGAGILLGGDAGLYRSAANTLKTDDVLSVGGRLYADGGLSVTSGGASVEGGFTVGSGGGTVEGGGMDITGTTTMNGALKHTGNSAGFFGAPTHSKITISSRRAEVPGGGSPALQDLLNALDTFGLITNNTTVV